MVALSLQETTPGETDKEETAFVEALNFLIRFPLLGSISHTIPSAPPLYMQEAFAEDETAFTPLHKRHETHHRLTSG